MVSKLYKFLDNCDSLIETVLFCDYPLTSYNTVSMESIFYEFM